MICAFRELPFGVRQQRPMTDITSELRTEP